MRKFFQILLFFLVCAGEFVQAQQANEDNVHQSANVPSYGMGSIILSENDGGVSGINSVPSYQCASTIAPSFEIVNYGSNILTNAVLEYFIDSNNPDLYLWEGSLEPGAIDTIQLNPIQVSAGYHLLTISILTANGSIDINGDNNDGLVNFYVVGTSIPSPVSENFAVNSLPEGYFVENGDGGPTWSLLQKDYQAGPSDYMMQMHFYYSNAGNVDEFYLKNIDLSNSFQAIMDFDVAYKYYKNSGIEKYDELKLLVSSDCGNDWTVLYDKEKDDLSTVSPDDIEFIPSSASQWRTETVDLSEYSGNSNVMLRFEAISGHGNNLYVDNLSISSLTGISETQNQLALLQIFPNPADDYALITCKDMPGEHPVIRVNNLIGQNIYDGPVVTSSTVEMNTLDWPQGIYLVNAFNGAVLIGSGKLVVAH